MLIGKASALLLGLFVFVLGREAVLHDAYVGNGSEWSRVCGGCALNYNTASFPTGLTVVSTTWSTSTSGSCVTGHPCAPTACTVGAGTRINSA